MGWHYQRLFILLVILVCVTLGHDHGHHHGHHGHQHHGHEHGHHGHQHGHHGHEHGHHGHHHGHHGHHHGHDDDMYGHNQKPASKWSKEANTQPKPKPEVVPLKQEEKKDQPKCGGKGHGHEHGHGHGEGHGHSHGKEEHVHAKSDEFKPPVKKEAVSWYEPILATAAISTAPFLILFLVPLDSNSADNQPILKVLLAFASGGLLGDAFLHLIPHAISPHSHDGSDHGHSHSHSHSHGGEEGHDHTENMMVGLWVLAGMMAFFVVEKCVRHIKGGHGHSHSHGAVNEEETKKEAVEGSEKKTDDDKKTEDAETTDDSEDKKDSKEKEESTDDQPPVEVVEPKKEIKISAYLNLVADCTHNFTDGLAIGASFLVSRNVGLITTLTIFLHEIPHEIGDFAILIQSGCTKRKAMSLQLVTAIGAFAGCICGLLAEGLGTAASAWILPFTAGGFIYIATVSVIPELLEETKFTQSLKEIFALLVGIFLMVVIAITE